MDTLDVAVDSGDGLVAGEPGVVVVITGGVVCCVVVGV